MSSRLSVVTVNYCSADEVLRGIQSTLATITALGGELWIVDNQSPDDSRDVLSAALAGMDGVHLILADRNGGFGYGNNQVIDRVLSGEIATDYVYFLNPDAIPEAGAIEAMVAYLDAHPDVSLVGSGLLNDDGTGTDPMFRFPSFWSEIEAAVNIGAVSRLLARYRRVLPALKAPGPVDWVAGTSFMARADALRRSKGFDEDFFLYWEEIELCHRLAACGLSIHGLPEAKVRHVGGASTGMHVATRRIPAYWHRSRNLYFRKVGYAGLPWLNLATGIGLTLWRAREVMRGRRGVRPCFVRDHFRHAWQDFLRPTAHSHPSRP